MAAISDHDRAIPQDPSFRTTQWTQVLAAAHESSGAEALAELCRAYWYPIYAYLRRRGLAPADAEDLTQEFFSRIIERRPFGELSREGGKFRSFLLKAIDRMAVDQWRKANSQKRGANKIVSMETRYLNEPSLAQSPEAAFDQAFAIALLEKVYAKLESEFAGRETLFAAIKPCLIGSRSNLPYAQLAANLGATEGAIKTHVHRLRGRFKTLLRGAVAETVSSPAEIDDELRQLLRVIAGG
jgi:RNA polymerase sigma factor (sigma-70 family)